MVDRRDFLRILCGGLAIIGLATMAWPQMRDLQKPPNFIFILTDDQGWGDLGCYGNPEIQTPNLDRLASQGSLFTQFYVAGPVCSPSRVGFVTGQFPARSKVLRPLGSHKQNSSMGVPDYLDPALPTIMRHLREKAGYATGHYGKWHLSGSDIPGGLREPPLYGVDEYKIEGNPKKDENRLFPKPPGRNHVLEADQYIFDEGIKFIERHQERPFYLNLWSPTPHIPLYPTEEQMAPYDHIRPHDPWPSAKEIYYAAVTSLDSHVGRLLARLDELGLAENTVVIFSSDNGAEGVYLNEDGNAGIGSTGPFRGHKVSLYEGGIRLPFIVRWPGKIPSRRVEDQSIVAAVDLLPTLCKLGGVEIDARVAQELDGEDISDILLGASRPRRKNLFWRNSFWYYTGTNDPVIHRSPVLAMREGDWKLLMNIDGSRKELYNIPDDPSEVDNKMDVQRSIGEQMASQLLNWHASMPEGVITFPPTMGDNTYPWPKGDWVAPAHF